MRNKNLIIQLNLRIDNLLAIGESKAAAKAEYKTYCKNNGIKYNPNTAPGIYDTDTAGGYRQTIHEFGGWLKENRTDVWNSKNQENITKEVCYEYLQYREVKSPWTVSKDQSALNKVLDLGLNKSEGNLSERSTANITRSRNASVNDTRYNPNNYVDQTEIASSFGVRRRDIFDPGYDKYAVKDVSLFTRNDHVFCSVISKGGRYNEVPCLESRKADILAKYPNMRIEDPIPEFIDRQLFSTSKEEFTELYNSSPNYLFDKYPTCIDNHAFRGEYARNLYTQLCEEKGEIKNDYRGFDRELVQEVSWALGHNRLSVVVDYYFK